MILLDWSLMETVPHIFWAFLLLFSKVCLVSATVFHAHHFQLDPPISLLRPIFETGRLKLREVRGRI